MAVQAQPPEAAEDLAALRVRADLEAAAAFLANAGLRGSAATLRELAQRSSAIAELLAA